MPTIQHPESKNQISAEILASLNKKLINGSSNWTERAALAHFTLNLDPMLGRAFAQYLNEIITTLEPAMPEANGEDMIEALKNLATFVSLVAAGEGEENPAVTIAWESFISRLEYPQGHNSGPEGMDIDAGIQRIKTAISVEKIQTEFFGKIINAYEPETVK